MSRTRTWWSGASVAQARSGPWLLETTRNGAEECEIQLRESARYLINPGSVGQPRDSDPRAAYLLLDLDARHASFRRVEYDVERTQREIREAGLPELLAARLELGI